MSDSHVSWQQAMPHTPLAIAHDLIRRCEVRHWDQQQPEGLGGRAYFSERRIECPVPVDTSGVYILAHECGHIALQHRRRLPAHRQEYEAERFAQFALPAYNIPVPTDCIEEGRQYVAGFVVRDAQANPGQIDPEVLEWTRPHLPLEIQRRLQDLVASNKTLLRARRFKELINDRFRFHHSGRVSFRESSAPQDATFTVSSPAVSLFGRRDKFRPS